MSASPLKVAWLAFVLPFSIAGALIPLRHVVAEADIALFLALVVIVVTVLGGRSTGTAAGLAAAIAFDLFFTRPYYSLRIDRAPDIETVVLMFILGVATGEIVTRGRQSRLAAQLARANLESASRVLELAAGGERPGRLIRVARRELIELLDLEACEFEWPPFLDTLPSLNHAGPLIPPGFGAELEPAHHETRLELPVRAEGLELGRFVLTFARADTVLDCSHDVRSSARLLADRLAVALCAHDR